MPKSRSSSIANRSTEPTFEEAEMSRRIEDRLGGLEVDVEVPSRTRGGNESLRVSFSGGTAQVHSSGSGNTYHVDMEAGTCDCPDYVNRQNRCRHIEAANMAQGQLEEGTGVGSSMPQNLHPGQVIGEYAIHESNAEIHNGSRDRQEDAFFYSDNQQQFHADAERVLREPIPYYYENALNGSDITFGIELEFVNGDSNAIAAELFEQGICSTAHMDRYHSTGAPGKWKLERDASVTSGGRGGEIISPILKDTPETWRQIETICEVAKRHGAQVNFETGGHVHIGAENAIDGKRQRWRRFFKMSTGYENVFHKLAGGEQGSFRGSHYAASSRNQNREGITRYMPSEGTTNEFQSILGDISNGKYQSINIGTFKSKKTVEFRAFNGTLNPGVIQANVKYAAGLINSAERSRTRQGDGFEVTEQDTRRGNIINNYQQIENAQSDKAIIDVLDSVCSRKEDKEHLLSVLMRNQWSNR